MRKMPVRMLVILIAAWSLLSGCADTKQASEGTLIRFFATRTAIMRFTAKWARCTVTAQGKTAAIGLRGCNDGNFLPRLRVEL